MPDQHPLTIEVLSAHLDYLLDRVRRTIEDAEALRTVNQALSERLSRTEAERDEALEDVNHYVEQVAALSEQLRAVTPTAVEGARD